MPKKKKIQIKIYIQKKLIFTDSFGQIYTRRNDKRWSERERATHIHTYIHTRRRIRHERKRKGEGPKRETNSRFSESLTRRGRPR